MGTKCRETGATSEVLVKLLLAFSIRKEVTVSLLSKGFCFLLGEYER